MFQLYQWMYLIHVLGAVALGYYFVLPFLLKRTRSLSGQPLAEFAGNVHAVGRIMQLFLLVQLVTGVYMMLGSRYEVFWETAVLVLLIAIGALTGIMGGKLKKAVKAINSGGDGTAALASVRTLSWWLFVALLLMVYVMTVHEYFFA
jgi:hypothetical protein